MQTKFSIEFPNQRFIPSTHYLYLFKLLWTKSYSRDANSPNSSAICSQWRLPTPTPTPPKRLHLQGRDRVFSCHQISRPSMGKNEVHCLSYEIVLPNWVIDNQVLYNCFSFLCMIVFPHKTLYLLKIVLLDNCGYIFLNIKWKEEVAQWWAVCNHCYIKCEHFIF